MSNLTNVVFMAPKDGSAVRMIKLSRGKGWPAKAMSKDIYITQLEWDTSSGGQLYALLERERAQQQQMKAEVAAAQQQAKEAMEKMREELTPKELISTEQLTALQSRLEALHAEQLLTDDELFALEVRTVLRLDLVDYTILW